MKYRMKRDRESPEYDSGKRRKLEQVCVNKQREKYYTDVSEEECEFLIRENGDKFGFRAVFQSRLGTIPTAAAYHSLR